MAVQLPNTGLCPRCGHMNLLTATECARCQVAFIPAKLAQPKPVWPKYAFGGLGATAVAFFGLIYYLGGQPPVVANTTGPGAFANGASNNYVMPPAGAPAAPALSPVTVAPSAPRSSAPAAPASPVAPSGGVSVPVAQPPVSTVTQAEVAYADEFMRWCETLDNGVRDLENNPNETGLALFAARVDAVWNKRLGYFNRPARFAEADALLAQGLMKLRSGNLMANMQGYAAADADFRAGAVLVGQAMKTAGTEMNSMGDEINRSAGGR